MYHHQEIFTTFLLVGPFTPLLTFLSEQQVVACYFGVDWSILIYAKIMLFVVFFCLLGYSLYKEFSINLLILPKLHVAPHRIPHYHTMHS